MTWRAHKMEGSIASNTQSTCRSRRAPTAFANGVVASWLENASQIENTTAQLLARSWKQTNVTCAFVHEHELQGTYGRIPS